MKDDIVLIYYEKQVGWWHWLFGDHLMGYGYRPSNWRGSWHSANTVRGLRRVIRRELLQLREPGKEAKL